MIFARFTGPEKKDLKLTTGRMYLADSGYRASDVFDATHIEIQDDEGKKVKIRPEKNLFEYFDKVFAVVLSDVGVLQKGQVVTITDSDEENKFFSVEGHGYLKASCFEILDGTNVVPGNSILDIKDQKWKEICRVDDSMNVSVGEEMRSILEFRLAVGNGTIMSQPLLKCTNAEGLSEELTEGKMYIAESLPVNDLIGIENDKGQHGTYMLSRFEVNF